jgi:pyruvate/2-oxoglutarate/acetoin dehydrogenase E1 component
VTEGLAAKHKMRVRDFPPDETALVGAGVGFSQIGLVPIVEIPYAKVGCLASFCFKHPLPRMNVISRFL